MNLRIPLRVRNIIIITLAAVLVVGLAIVIASPSGASSNNLSAKLSEIIGIVQVRNGSQASFDPVNNGFLLNEIMQLQTQQESKVRLDLSTGSIVRLGQSTIFSLESQQAGSGGVLSKIKLQVGRLWAVLNGGSLDVTTPAGLASVRGSYMSVWVEAATGTVAVSCLEGHCAYQNAAGDVEMTSGQKITSSNPNTLPTIEKMDQADLQSWRDNCPESAAVIPQVINLLATSTPTLSLTPTSTGTVTSTPTLSLSALLTLTAAPPSGPGTGTPALLGSLTATFNAAQTATLTPRGTITPTSTRGTQPAGVPTNTSAPPGSTPLPTSTSLPGPTTTSLPGPTATSLPAPSNTPPPAPSNTPLPPPTNTPLPPPTSTPLPPPTNTPVPPPTNTPVPYP